ncbi:MAG: dTDP-4-dehydrorhamnose reductase [Acidobacteriota bacterium]
MRALVFGGEGMLGQAVAAEGQRRGATVEALGRQRADITDGAAVGRWVDEQRPEVIFNCAAFTKVDDCEAQSALADQVNGHAVGHLVPAARRVGAHLVQVSTDYVFDGQATSPYGEDHPTAPASAYGRSKLLGEQQALAYEHGLAVRVSWLFGPGGPNFAATMVRLMDSGHQQLRVVDDQKGCPTYTPFLAEALWRLAELRTTGILHYCNRDAVTWYGFTREIARHWNDTVEVLPVTTDEFPRPAPRPAYSVLDVARYESLVGERVPTWESGLVEYLAGLRQRR